MESVWDKLQFVNYLAEHKMIDGLARVKYTTKIEENSAFDILTVLLEEAVEETTLIDAVADYCAFGVIESIYDHRLGSEIYSVDVNQALKHKVLPILQDTNKEFGFLICDPFDVEVQRLLSLWGKNKTFSIWICSVSVFDKFLKHNNNAIQEILGNSVGTRSGDEIALLLEQILTDGDKQRASDIRFFRDGERGRITFRIDGDIQRYLDIDIHTLDRLCKDIENGQGSTVDNTNPDVPRTGIKRISIREKDYELRCNWLPTKNGVDTNIRYLVKDNFDLNRLGLNDDRKQVFQSILNKDRGLYLFTGPTGSGKSTSVYSLLEIARHNRTICTVEDPVEHKMDGVAQVEANISVSWTDAIKSFLRHDPDIITIGEMRDGAVASHAFTAANTGHLVFSTLHTNSAISSIARLRDLGVSNSEIADNLQAVVAQTLVKRVCPMCSTSNTYTLTEVFEFLEIKATKVREYVRLKLGTKYTEDAFELRTEVEDYSCTYCDGRGTKGRCLATEILVPDDEVREMILQDSSMFEIQSQVSGQLLRIEVDVLSHLIDGTIGMLAAKKILRG